MKHLAYIPSKIDKNNLYKELDQLQIKNQQVSSIQVTSQKQQKQKEIKKSLNQQELNQLLRRLVKNTQKQYDTQQQTTYILAANMELKKKRLEGEKVQNRLIQYGKKIEEKKNQLGIQLENQMKQKYFRDIPQISTKAKNIKQKAIEKRLDKLIEQRTKKLDKLKLKYQPKFQPTIDPYSEFINDLENYGDLQNRMEFRQKEAGKRKESIVKQVEEKKKQVFTFQPAINGNSKYMAQNMLRRPLFEANSLSHSPLTNKQMDPEIYPFIPQINKNTEQLLKNKAHNQNDDCFSRLYNQAKQISRKRSDKMVQRDRASSFRPSLNQRSLKIASSISKKKDMTSRNEPTDQDNQQFEQVRIGISHNQLSRIKSYSVRHITDESDWQLNLKQKCMDVLHRDHKLKMSTRR